MLSRMPLLLVTNLADVDRIGQQLVQRAARKAQPAGSYSPLGNADLRQDTVPVELLLQLRYRTCFQITVVDLPYRRSFSLIDDQTAIVDVVPDRWTSAHPDSLSFRGRDLVSYPLSRHLAF